MKNLELQKTELLQSMALASSALEEGSEPGRNAINPKEAAMALSKNAKILEEVETKLENLEERWLELSQKMESASASASHS